VQDSPARLSNILRMKRSQKSSNQESREIINKGKGKSKAELKKEIAVVEVSKCGVCRGAKPCARQVENGEQSNEREYKRKKSKWYMQKQGAGRRSKDAIANVQRRRSWARGQRCQD